MERPKIIPGAMNNQIQIPPSQGKAAIRYKNPGAAWPSSTAVRYGMLGWGHLADGANGGNGNKIALFPTAVHGAAANMALLATSKNYLGRTIGQGQRTWSGGNRTGLPGWDSAKVITKELTRDPKFMIDFMKAIAEYEAPGGSKVLTAQQWEDAFNLYMLVEAGVRAETIKKVVVATTSATATAAATGWTWPALMPVVIAVIAVVAIVGGVIYFRNRD